jgi:hypothetical protein
MDKHIITFKYKGEVMQTRACLHSDDFIWVENHPDYQEDYLACDLDDFYEKLTDIAPKNYHTTSELRVVPNGYLIGIGHYLSEQAKQILDMSSDSEGIELCNFLYPVMSAIEALKHYGLTNAEIREVIKKVYKKELSLF